MDHSRRSCPHQVTAPSLGSMNRINRRMSVVFPDPVEPTMPTVVCASMSTLMPSRTVSRPG